MFHTPVCPTAGRSFRVIAHCSKVSPARFHPALSKEPGLDSAACSETRSLPAFALNLVGLKSDRSPFTDDQPILQEDEFKLRCLCYHSGAMRKGRQSLQDPRSDLGALRTPSSAAHGDGGGAGPGEPWLHFGRRKPHLKITYEMFKSSPKHNSFAKIFFPIAKVILINYLKKKSVSTGVPGWLSPQSLRLLSSSLTMDAEITLKKISKYQEKK